MKTIPVISDQAGTLSLEVQKDRERLERQIAALEDLLTQEQDAKSRKIYEKTLKGLQAQLGQKVCRRKHTAHPF